MQSIQNNDTRHSGTGSSGSRNSGSAKSEHREHAALAPHHHDYDDGLVHSHAWAYSDQDRHNL